MDVALVSPWRHQRHIHAVAPGLPREDRAVEELPCGADNARPDHLRRRNCRVELDLDLQRAARMLDGQPGPAVENGEIVADRAGDHKRGADADRAEDTDGLV